jgi:hypothetical protein
MVDFQLQCLITGRYIDNNKLLWFINQSINYVWLITPITIVIIYIYMIYKLWVLLPCWDNKHDIELRHLNHYLKTEFLFIRLQIILLVISLSYPQSMIGVSKKKHNPEQKTICTNITIYIHLY